MFAHNMLTRQTSAKNIWRIVGLLAALLLILAACGGREDEALPTVAPTAVPPTPVSADETEGIAAAEPTAVPAPVPPKTIDPAAIDWPPQLVFSSPHPGEEALLDGAITLRFDQPMDQPSVEAAFTIEPAVEGTFTWARVDTLVFTPQEKLAHRQSYKVRVARSAAGLNGRLLDDLIELNLETVGFLAVSQVIPASDGRDIQTDSAITTIFNRPVVPLTPTSQQSRLPQPLTFTPAIAGQGQWVSTSIYRFVPAGPLAGATTYQVEVAADLADVTGAALDNGFSWQFTTMPPAVVSVEPLFERPIAPSQPISVTFNMPMERTSTETAVTLQSESGAAAVDYRWSDDGRVLSLVPQGQLPLETPFTLVVAQSARAASGQATLEGETSYALNTVPFPAVLNTTPADGGQPERWQTGFTVTFASLMDIDTLEGRIIIDPPPANEPDYYFNDFDNQLYTSFTLTANAEYTITIPGDAADPYGNTLGEPYTWRFVTANLPPVASFNLPPQVSQLSTSFPSDVEIIHRNATQLDVTLYDLGLPLSLINQPYELYDFRPAANPLRTYSYAPATAQGQVGLQAVSLANGGVLPTGIYLLQVKAPNLPEDSRFWQNQSNIIIVADTNIVTKEMFGTVHVWVTDLASGQPAGGRNLTLYSQQGAPLATAVSDNSGFASFAYEPPQGYLEGVTVVSNAPGQAGFGVAHSGWAGGVSPWQLGITTNTSAEQEFSAYIYTDRPIYRPGDTVHFKGIFRENGYGRYRIPAPQTLNVKVNTAFYDPEGGLEETLTVQTDADGVFSGDYVLPPGTQLGNYQFWIDKSGTEGFRSFLVAEYRKPEFQVFLTPDRAELLRGEIVQVELQAEYFFGGTAADLAVSWIVYEEAYYPDVPGPFYAFGDFGNFFYEDTGFFFGGGGPLGNYVSGGQGVTDSNGRLTITLPADLLAEVDEGSRRINVEATLTDLTNFPVSARTSVIFHAAQSYVGIIPADYTALVGTTATVNLLSVDWSGKASPGQDVEVVFYEREWQRLRDTSFGTYRTVWEPIDMEVDRQQVTTDSLGKGSTGFVPQNGGTYVAVATLTDPGGQMTTSSTIVWAIDPTYGGWRSDSKVRSMDLVPDKQSYKPGETARILVQSPFTEPVQAWLTIERGELLQQRVIQLNGSSEVVEIPLTPDFAPNVHVTLTAVKPVTPNNPDNPYADIRLGLAEITVSPEQLGLNVALQPREELFMPGETAVYDIQVTNYAGQPVAAELSLALVDLAVLILAEDNAPPILDAFYQLQPYRSQIGGSLFISGEGLEPEIPLEGGGLGGGGGGEEARLALALEEEDDARSDFPDTAYWAAKIQTDADGTATVEIPLPDTLTTWRLSSKAVTSDTLVGQAAVDVVVSLPLLVRPVTPRFFTVGDVVQLGAIINNNTGQALETVVTLAVRGLTLNDPAEQALTVPANGRQLVRWEVVADQIVDFADLTFRVTSDDYRDASKPGFGIGPDKLIPIRRFTGDDFVGTAGVLTEAERRVEALFLPPEADSQLGQVDLNLSPSLAAALLDGLQAANELDYERICAHAVAYHLLPNVATAVAVRELDLDKPELATQLDSLINEALSQLERLALAGGGWGWCDSSEKDPFLTANILLAMVKAEQAGYSVPRQALVEGGFYLADFLNKNPLGVQPEPYEINQRAFYVYVLSEMGQPPAKLRDELADKRRALLSPSSRALLALSYELDGTADERQQTLLADLGTMAVVSATGTHWEDDTPDAWRYLGSDVHETAVVIDVLSQLDPANELLPGAVRWLMVARTGLYWAAPYQTAWSILGLSGWMLASGELDASYDYLLNINAETVAEGQFSAETLLEANRLSWPVSKLVPGEVNFFDIQRGAGNGRLYYTLQLNSALDASQVGAVNRGLSIQRTYYEATCDPQTEDCQPISQIKAGQKVRVQLDISVPDNLIYVIIEDPLPAGAEGIDPNLQTSASGLGPDVASQDYRAGYWGYWFFNRVEFRDEKVLFLAAFLPAGAYQYTYFLQTNIPGEYQVRPATARQEFFPDVFGRSDGLLLTIEE